MKKLIVMLMLGVLAAAQADVLVSFEPSTNWVTASANGQGLSGGKVPFSMSLVRSPTNGAGGYYGPVYYGGATGDVALVSWQIANSTPDYLTSGTANVTNPIGTKIAAVWMFTNQASTVTQFVWATRLGGNLNAFTNLARMVVRKTDGSFFISESFGDRNGTTKTNANPASWLWYNYDPNTSLRDIGTQVSGFSLSGINAIGQWQESTITMANTNNTPSLGLKNFQVWGTVIPEPATVGMLGLGALITLLVRRLKS